LKSTSALGPPDAGGGRSSASEVFGLKPFFDAQATNVLSTLK